MDKSLEMYDVFLYKKAKKFIDKQDKKTQKILQKKINSLKENPFAGKPLVGNLTGLRSLRVEKYRIIYQKIEKKLLVLVLEIGHRKNIY